MTRVSSFGKKNEELVLCIELMNMIGSNDINNKHTI